MKKRLILLLLTIILYNNSPVYSEEPTSKDQTLELNDSSQSHSELIYKDTSRKHWAYQSILELSNKYKILAGYTDDSFKGNNLPSREELAQLVNLLATKIENDQVQLSFLDQAALKGLKTEFEDEILTLTARIEKNETKITNVESKHKQDITSITSCLNDYKTRHFFSPELRFRYAFGEYTPRGEGAYANTRLRLNSNTELYKNTFAVVRLQVATANILKMSENGHEIPDAKLTLGYIKTGDLTSYIPKKYGNVDIYGGIMPANRFFTVNNYTVNVDQRGFSDSNSSLSVYNNQLSAIARESTNGRRIAIGGEYYKNFNKYMGLFRVGTIRTGGGSLEGGAARSGRESTFFCAMAQMDIPVHKQPVQLKFNHFYSHDDNGYARNTYSIGGRLSTKFNNIGVFKIAGIGYGGTVAPRMIEGVGGKGFTLQFSYDPTIKAFGKLFGDPDKITHDLPNVVPGKTEVGFSASHFKNGADVTLNALDLTFSRYFSSNIFGRMTFSRANPSWHGKGLSTRNSILLETIFKI